MRPDSCAVLPAGSAFGSKQRPLCRLGLLGHRGPDDRGEESYLSASCQVAAVLGSTRLAILDLSSAGHMPMEHPEEPLALVYNGEIYNFPELRRELEGAGERFRSRTDTEVILRGYRVWGDGVVARLRGMFAFALWDGRGEGRLLLARDRFGKKPLYYRHDDHQGLAFSSELKTLLAVGSPRQVDPEGLAYFLDRGYPPPDRCLLDRFSEGGARQPPGLGPGETQGDALLAAPPGTPGRCRHVFRAGGGALAGKPGGRHPAPAGGGCPRGPAPFRGRGFQLSPGSYGPAVP